MNISVNNIKKSLETVKDLFDPTKDTYTIINDCINKEMTASDMLEHLNKIGSTNNYPPELQDFFYERFEELKLLAELDKKIEYDLSEIEKKDRDLELEFKKRNLDYNGAFDLKDDYKKMSYQEKKEYLEKLDLDLVMLNDKKSDLVIEKESSEKFNDSIEKKLYTEDDLLSKHNESIDKIQEKSEKNVMYYSNFSVQDVSNYVNFYRDNQSENSNFHIKIDIQEGNTKLDIGYEGIAVNEKYPAIQCVFTDDEYFKKEILPFLIQEHVIDGGIKGYNIEGDQLASENLNGEKMEISGTTDDVIGVEKSLKENVYVDEKQKKNDNIRVRKLELDKQGIANLMKLLIVLIGALFITIFLIIIL